MSRVESLSLNEVREYLSSHNIRTSFYRLKILEYLINKKSHPTADEIYQVLKKDIPSLSLATIYNTLNLFLEKKIVHLVNVEKNEARYDATLPWHGHFKCLKCGRILDVKIENLELKGLEDFDIHEKHLEIKGLCSLCRTIQKS